MHAWIQRTTKSMDSLFVSHQNIIVQQMHLFLSQSMRKSCLPLSGISCNFWDGLFLMTPNPHQDNLLLALWVGEWIRIFIKGRTLGKTYYGIKARVLLGTPLGNLLGTWMEQRKNEKKHTLLLPSLPNPKLKRKKNQGTLSACWALLRLLAAWNFSFQNCLSSFLAWANTHHYKQTSSACWALLRLLAAWNFYFQNCLSPFLAWANTHHYKQTLSACWALLRLLAAWNFYFQNCLSSFLAWANIPITINKLWVHAEPYFVCLLHEISISKIVCHHFWPGLIYHHYK